MLSQFCNEFALPANWWCSDWLRRFFLSFFLSFFSYLDSLGSFADQPLLRFRLTPSTPPPAAAAVLFLSVLIAYPGSVCSNCNRRVSSPFLFFFSLLFPSLFFFLFFSFFRRSSLTLLKHRAPVCD